MKLTNNLPSKAIVTTYIRATNYKPSRLKANDGDGNTLTLPYSHCEDLARNRGCTHNYSVYASVAMALIEKMGWKCETLECGSMPKGYVFIMVD